MGESLFRAPGLQVTSAEDSLPGFIRSLFKLRE